MIFLKVSRRLSWLTYAQHALEWSLQLVECPMSAIKLLQSWSLLPALKGVLMHVKYHSEICTPFTMIEVMNSIKKVLVKGLQCLDEKYEHQAIYSLECSSGCHQSSNDRLSSIQ
jgi:hypothetical protein